MQNDVDAITQRVDEGIRTGVRPPETTDISDQLALALATHPDREELKVLNYRWQTFLNKEYVREHKLDDFLESIVQQLLKSRSERPLEEMLVILEKSRPA